MTILFLNMKIFFLFAILPALFLPVMAQESTISVFTNDITYDVGDTIAISGQVSNFVKDQILTLTILQNQNTVTISQLTVAQDGSYSNVQTAWNNEGEYTVRVTYGDSTTETKFNIIYTQTDSCVGCIINEGNPISIYTEKSTYEYNETVKVYGRIMDNSIREVEIRLINSNGDHVSTQQVYLDGLNNYNAKFELVGPLMKESGEYDVVVIAKKWSQQKSFYMYGEPKQQGNFVKSKTHYSDTVHTSSEKIEIAFGSTIHGCEENYTCYVPYNLLIKPGDRVTWYNTDSAAHTATSGQTKYGPDGTFDTGLIKATKTYSLTLHQKGIYAYFCMIHPWMDGQITVGDVEYYPDTLPSSTGSKKFDAREMLDKNQKILTQNKQLKEKVSEANTKISQLLEQIARHLKHIESLESILQQYGH